VFLHIGAHKTGTSYLQAMFHNNRALLAQHGLHYPDIGPNNAHHALAAPWLSTPDIPDSFFGSRGRAGPWDMLTERYARAPGTVFLSAENFSRVRPQRVNMRELADRLRPFDEVRIVYTMRQQADLVQSLWMQVAKGDRVPLLRKYVETALEDRRGAGVPIDHTSVYSDLLTGFDPQQILLVDYNSLRRAEGGIVGHFLRLMGCDLDADALAPLTSIERANVSPDPIALYMATEVTRQQVPPAELVALIAQVVRPAGSPPASLLSRSEYNKMRNRFVHSNTTLAERVQPVQPGFTFDPGRVPADLFCRDDLTAEHWKRVAQALFAPPAPPQHDMADTVPSLLRRFLPGG
ncbi:MAG TPA: hypothetical protein VLA45_12840, partial [Paracoccaceae bacterium]|nr:hypothetical protein [Paracoccaceae bacterium]